MAKIKDVIFEYSVRNKANENINVYSVTNEKGFCTDYFSKEVASKDKTAYKIVPRGYFAYNPSRINVGSIDWQNHEDRVIVSPLYVVFGVSKHIDQQYLLYYLKSDIMLSLIKESATGSVRDNLKLSTLEEFPINLRPIDEQRHIAAVLDKVSDLIAKRKQQLDKLDELVKARFVEMFGQDNYPCHALIELITTGAGLSYGIVQPGDEGTGDMGVLRPVDLVDGGISTAAIKYIDRSIGNGFKKTELTGNELLITVRGTTGITALTDSRFKNMNVTRGIAVIRYDQSKINPIYLNCYLNSNESQHYIQEHTRGATLQQINLSDLRTLQISVPPMILQEDFAVFVKQIDKLKLTIQRSCDKLEVLKKGADAAVFWVRNGVYKMDEYKITMSIEPTNDYMKAKQDILQAIMSIQKLSPTEQQRLAEELLGTTQFMVLNQMFHQYWR